MKKDYQEGFTLVEVIAATLILVLGLTMTNQIVSGLISKNFHSLRHTQAVILAQNKIEELQNLGYNAAELQDGEYQNPLNPVNETGDSSGVFTQSWSINDVEPISKSKLIKSTVLWIDAEGVEQGVTLTSVCIDQSN